MIVVAVALGALFGAPLRYALDHAVAVRFHPRFPWAIFLVNVMGSLALGGLTAAAGELSDGAAAFLGAGFCGGLTTYSTFGHQTIRLAENSEAGLAVLNVIATTVAGLAAALLGWELVALILRY